MIQILQSLDEQLLLLINGLHAPVMDRFMYAFTGRWIWVPMYMALAWYLLRSLGRNKGIMCILFVGLAAGLADQTCATLIRPVIERARPANLDNPLSAAIHIVNGYRGGAYGFPSCHAANTFALATFFGWLNRRSPLTVMLFVWAIANCYTRMYLGVHYPGDLLAGAGVGMGSGSLCYMGARSLIRLPRLSATAFIKPVLAVAGVILAAILAWSLVW